MVYGEYNYLLNFYFYLYQISFYFFKKYGLYFYPYKFLLFDDKEIIYLYFVVFKKFVKQVYVEKRKYRNVSFYLLKKKLSNFGLFNSIKRRIQYFNEG